ncbi:hypothetical protein ACOME3_000872 [Neoechinorhynchus agilis]
MLRNDQVTEFDIFRVVSKLSILGVKIVEIPGKTKMVQIYPSELGNDQIDVLACLSNNPSGVRLIDLCEQCGWNCDISYERAYSAVRDLMIAGVVWFDKVDETYWVASFFIQHRS